MSHGVHPVTTAKKGIFLTNQAMQYRGVGISTGGKKLIRFVSYKP